MLHTNSRARAGRRRVAIFGALALMAITVQLQLAGPAAAAAYTGGLSPTVIDGGADLNGDNDVSGRDDSNAFYGDTAIIDGGLDCDAWLTSNDGTGGDLAITLDDDCTLVGVDGTADGVTIDVVDGAFQVGDGALPTVFNAADPDNPDVGSSDFAWSTIGGKVDSNGSETINANDCTFGWIGQTNDVGQGVDATDGADVLGNTQTDTNPCGFADPPPASMNGLVDLNSDETITATDSCDACILGHDLEEGFVQDTSTHPAPPDGALTGGFSPTIWSGLADLNGDGVVSGRDDSNAFYGDTAIIDGSLDCDAWTSDNDGTGGSGTITAADDCTLIGVDSTPDGVTIEVVDGEFQTGDGPLPEVFNAAEPDNPDVGDSDFAWSAIGGRVDSSGNELITANDCTFGLIGQTVDPGLGDGTDGADVLGNTQAETNPCGFGSVDGPDPASNGLVDLNSDIAITAADSCTDCFFGHDLQDGFVVDVGVTPEPECAGYEGDPRNDVIGTSGDDDLVGTAAADIICAMGGDDVVGAGKGADLVLSGGGIDLAKGGAGGDTVKGGGGGDELRGGNGPDELMGGDGNDDLFGNDGADHLACGGGNNDSAVGGPGNDTFGGCEHRTQ